MSAALYILLSHGPTSSIDVWATQLALESRGRRVLSGQMCRLERELLAAQIPEPDNDPLVELLRSERPIRVRATTYGYEFEEA